MFAENAGLSQRILCGMAVLDIPPTVGRFLTRHVSVGRILERDVSSFGG